LGVGSSIYKPGDDARTVEGKAQALVNALIARKNGAGSIREKLMAFAEAEGIPL